MFSHVTIGTNAPNRALVFYDRLLVPLGLARIAQHGDAAGYAAAEDASP